MDDRKHEDLMLALGRPGHPAAQVAVMAEGVESVYRYHLRPPGNYRAFCGHPVMHTSARLDSWGFVPEHIPHSYCEDCRELARFRPEERDG